MTRPLYHEDATRLSFTATVVAVRQKAAVLDATAFYPEGGGQNGDAGVLRWPGGEVRVTDTRKDKASGVVWHELEGDSPPVGTSITGEVDAARRWRHMARHSAEHLLAQAFVRIDPAFRVAAVSMRSAEITLDLEGQPTQADVRAAEALLRGTLARTDLTLKTVTVPEAELSRYPLRRETQVRGDVRLVIFREQDGVPFDVSACGGTHLPRASMAAPVAVLRTERVRAGLTRVVFLAGEEATEYLGGVYTQARELAQGFSVPVEALPGRIAALTADRETQKTEINLLRLRLAHTLVRQAPALDVNGMTLREVTLDDVTLLSAVLSDVLPGEIVAALAPGGRCGVGSRRGDVPAGPLLQAALKVTGGQGGGQPLFAQGSTQTPETFLQAVRDALAALHAAS